MFSYYGSKSKIVQYYPKPTKDTIIEPFAGRASYALHDDNWQRKVILRDLSDKVIAVWHYLQTATEDDILALPYNISDGQELDDFDWLSDQERWLIGFCCNGGSSSPKNIAGRGSFNGWHRYRMKIADSIHKIKHWDIRLGTYSSIEDQDATWFIDPPYQFGGNYYPHQFRDFKSLREWTLNRTGQVIVCENTKATWLDFKPLVCISGQLHKTVEAIWTN